MMVSAKEEAKGCIKRAIDLLAKEESYDATLDTLTQALYELGNDDGEEATEFLEIAKGEVQPMSGTKEIKTVDGTAIVPEEWGTSSSETPFTSWGEIPPAEGESDVMAHFTSEELVAIHDQVLKRWEEMPHEEWKEYKDHLRKFLDFTEEILSGRQHAARRQT